MTLSIEEQLPGSLNGVAMTCSDSKAKRYLVKLFKKLCNQQRYLKSDEQSKFIIQVIINNYSDVSVNCPGNQIINQQLNNYGNYGQPSRHE